ncbi:MAG: hypothetical protein JO257_32665 [Deltaproteobacteria bacterium]|nr:hypothetical protein [Deltaproteobacteria bacterium]
MLRAVLLGLVSIAVVSCNKKQDAPAAQAGAPAGTVVDVQGTVTVAGKPLAKGATVNGDDVVDTGADGHVRIVLAHNNATWDLGPNKHEKVSASLAWTLAKVDTPAKAVDQDTSSAGRPAERAAAETAASSDKKDMEERADEAAPAPAAAPQAPGAPAAAAPAAVAAPAPPPPPPPPAAEPAPGGARGAKEMPAPPAKTATGARAVPDDTDGLLGKPSGGGGGAPPKPPKLDVPIEAYQKCVSAGMTLKLGLKGTAKGTTWTVLNSAPISLAVKQCLDKVTATVHLPAGAHTNIEIAK